MTGLRIFGANKGVSAGIINLGGNLLFVGPSPRRDDGQWVIGVQDPQLHRGENMEVVRQAACSAVTSESTNDF